MSHRNFLSRLYQSALTRFESKNLWRWACASLAVQCVYSLFVWRPQSFVYGVHRYFAHQVIDGLDPYSIAGCVPEAPAAMLHFLPPRLLTHSGLFWGEDVTGWPLYLLFQWLALLAGVLLVRRLVQRQVLSEEIGRLLYILMAFNPAMISLGVILLGDWLFRVPLVLILLLAIARAPWLGGLIAGLSVGWSVELIFLAPVVFLSGIQRAERFTPMLIIPPTVAWSVGLALAVFPFSLNGLVGLQRWFNGSADSYWWYSIWGLLGDFYVPGTSLIVMALSVTGVTSLYASGRLSLPGAVILSLVSTGLFSNYAPDMVILVTGLSMVMGMSGVPGSRLVAALVWLQAQTLVFWRIVNGHLLEDRFQLFFGNHRHGFPIDGAEALVMWAPVIAAVVWTVRRACISTLDVPNNVGTADAGASLTR